MNELIKEDKPKTIILGDKTFTLSPINLNILTAIEDEFNCTLGEISQKFSERQAGTLRSIIWILIRENHDITIDEIGKLITLADIERVSNMVMSIIEDK